MYKTMTENMAKTGLQRNEGQGLHVKLVGMLVTSFLFQKSHCIFFLLVFIALSNASSSSLRVKYEAFRSKYLGIEMKIFKMKSV